MNILTIFKIYITFVLNNLFLFDFKILQGSLPCNSSISSVVELVQCASSPNDCILASFVCDVIPDCPDQSDESNATCRGSKISSFVSTLSLYYNHFVFTFNCRLTKCKRNHPNKPIADAAVRMSCFSDSRLNSEFCRIYLYQSVYTRLMITTAVKERKTCHCY